MTPKISPDQLESVIKILESHPKAKQDVVRPPGEVYLMPIADGYAVYINFVRSEDVPIGCAYNTWIVQIYNHGDPWVGYFRSLRGENGDKTVPPD
jgi:hypothetical protein